MFKRLFPSFSDYLKDGLNKIKQNNVYQKHHAQHQQNCAEYDRLRYELYRNYYNNTHRYNTHSNTGSSGSGSGGGTSSGSNNNYSFNNNGGKTHYQHHYNFHNKSHSNHFRSHFYNHYYRRYYNRPNGGSGERTRHNHHCNPHTRTDQHGGQYQQCHKNKLLYILGYKLHHVIKHPIFYYFLNSNCKIDNSDSIFKNKIYTTTTTTTTNNNNNNNNNSVQTKTTTATTTTTTTKSNMSTTILLQNTTSNKQFGDSSRYFSNSAPQMFILSKAARIFVPIAMTGVRKYMTKINLLQRISLIFVILASATGTYLAMNKDEAPVTGRSRLVSYSREEEHDLGQMGYDEMTKEYSSYFLPENNVLQNRVREIAKRIIDVTDRKDLEWECHVVNSQTVNACVLPNGKIFVFSGLFDLCESEDELASVLSHEIGHAVARHAAERMSISKLGYMFLTLTRGLVGETITGNLTTLFSANLLNLRYSRIQEMEADAIGLEFMAKANYNPYAALSMQNKLKKHTLNNELSISESNDISNQSQSKVIDFLSTHPSPEERIQKIEKWLELNASKFKNQQPILINQQQQQQQQNNNNNPPAVAQPKKLSTQNIESFLVNKK